MPDSVVFREGGLDDPRVVALVNHHVGLALKATPAGKSHGIAIDGLRAPGVRFWSAWDGDELLAIGAMRPVDHGHVELKSMHTVESARGRGIGGRMLRHIEAAARAAGNERISLESHPGDYFAAAVALYRRHGYGDCGPFGAHQADPASLFMTKKLD